MDFLRGGLNFPRSGLKWTLCFELVLQVQTRVHGNSSPVAILAAFPQLAFHEREFRRHMLDMAGADSDNDSLCMGENPADEDTHMCYACGEEDVLANLPKEHEGHKFHCPCFNGVRSHNRIIAVDPKLQAEANHDYRKNPAAWRVRIAPFLVKEGGVRRTQAVKQLQQLIHEHKTKQ